MTVQMMKLIDSDIILHHVDLEKTHLRTECHTWTVFLYHLMSVAICLIQSSCTLNLPLVCGTSRHFIALMTTLLCFHTVPEKARERGREREYVMI